MAVGENIPAEPGFRDGRPLHSWRIEWDEEWFCHVEAVDQEEAVRKAIEFMASKSNKYTIETHPRPAYASIVKEWVVATTLYRIMKTEDEQL